MAKELAKSPEVLQKEAEIAALEKALKKKRTTLKSLKTRLKNTHERITDMQRGSQVQLMNKMEDLDNLRIEIAQLAEELKNVKGMSEEEKAELGEMANSMANEGFGEDFDEFKSKRERMASGDFDFEEEFGDRIRDMFEPFKVQPDEKEKRNIRKVFLNLSKKFHPDKARDAAQAEEYHSVMQKINEAYQNNDIETLLEMERLYIREEPDFEGVAMADILQQKIDYLNREIAFISNQAERTSAEIKSLRASDLGQMLTNLDRADREGEGMDKMIAHLDVSIDIFTKLRDALKDSIELGEVSPKIEEVMMEMMKIGMAEQVNALDSMMKPPESVEEMAEMMQQMADMMGVDLSDMMGGDGGDDLFDMFGESRTTNPNPKFPEESSVRVVKNVKSPVMQKVNMKSWEGRVIDAFIDSDGENVYEIAFDSITVNAMSEDYIEHAVEEMEPFGQHTFYEHQLKATKARDTFNETIATYRIKYHSLTWEYLGDEQAAALKGIMLAHPSMSDHENWEHYLNQNIRFPFDVVTMGNLVNPPGLKAKLMSIEEADPSAGILVNIKIPGVGMESYPLMDLTCAKKKDKQQATLDLYHEWAEEELDMMS